eukprot:sb/3474071/
MSICYFRNPRSASRRSRRTYSEYLALVVASPDNTAIRTRTLVGERGNKAKNINWKEFNQVKGRWGYYQLNTHASPCYFRNPRSASRRSRRAGAEGYYRFLVDLLVGRGRSHVKHLPISWGAGERCYTRSYATDVAFKLLRKQ